MNLFKKAIVVLAIVSLFLCSTADARSRKSSKIDVSKEDVQQFVKVFPLMLKEFSKIKLPSKKRGVPKVKTLKELYKKAGVSPKKVEKFAKENGYKDLKSFEDINSAILRAFAVIEIENNLSTITSQASSVPPALRPMLEAKLKPAKRQLKKLKKDTTPTTLKNVEPLSSQIRAIVQAYQGKSKYK